jgi:hypothetical protein
MQRTYSNPDPHGDFNMEAILTMDKDKEFGYVANMACPVPKCNFPGTFSSRERFQRHCEERHSEEVQKWACPYQGCKTMVRRKSDMKSHFKFVHHQTDASHINMILVKATSNIVRATNYINPGLLRYTFRRISRDSEMPAPPSETRALAMRKCLRRRCAL